VGGLSIVILTLTSPINLKMPTKSALVLETKGSFVPLFHSHTSERDYIDYDTFYVFFIFFVEAETTKVLNELRGNSV